MGLKAVLDKAAYDALPDATKAFYVEDKGSYVLDAEVEDHPKTKALKGALDKERTSKTDVEKEFAALKKRVGDLDPEKARAALDQMQAMADKKLLDEGQIEEFVKTKTERMRIDHEGQVNGFKTSLAEKDQKLGALSGRLKTLVLDGGIRDKAITLGAKPEHVDDIISRMTTRGVEGIRWDLQDDENVVAKKGEQIAYGKDASKPMPIEEGLELLREKVPGFFAPSSGGGAQNKGAQQQGGRYVITEAAARDRAAYQQAQAEANKAGVPLVIQG